MDKKNVFLIGFMGCGKTTLSRMLAEAQGKQLVDLDGQIESEEQMTINEMFEKYGETYFRDKESALIKRISDVGNAVVACGGGAVLRQENLDNMRANGKIVYLSATPETIFERVRHSTHRPLLNGNMNLEYIEELMKKRLPIYEQAADVTIQVDGKTKSEVLAELKNYAD